GFTDDDTDCDDSDGSVHPDGEEVCGDGIDQDCSGTADDDDEQWWNEDWSYRIPLTVSAPDTDIAGAPVAVTVDFADALDDLGDSGD
ncbi:MAG: MopE-related protein, partial [Myxococcota bacterium]|nr:MopE-related protein [Myxococcota bacterium]